MQQRLKKWFRWSAWACAGIGALWLAVAGLLIAWPVKEFRRPPAATAKPAPLDEDCHHEHLPMTDGTRIHACIYDATTSNPGSKATTRVVLLHGMAGTASDLRHLAPTLRHRAGAEVVILDLRGHGQSAGAPGDLPRIGTFEQDLAEALRQLAARKPAARLILGGHSAGGGIVLRYAAARLQPPADGYLLLAPHLGHDAPTVTGNASGANTNTSSNAEPPIRLHLARTIGLTMWNAAGIEWFNGMTTLALNQPPDAPLRGYTYRAMLGLAPENHRAALTADSKPALVLVGEKDEAFPAKTLIDVVARAHPNAETAVIESVGHDSILRSEIAFGLAAKWLNALR